MTHARTYVPRHAVSDGDDGVVVDENAGAETDGGGEGETDHPGPVSGLCHSPTDDARIRPETHL